MEVAFNEAGFADEWYKCYKSEQKRTEGGLRSMRQESGQV